MEVKVKDLLLMVMLCTAIPSVCSWLIKSSWWRYRPPTTTTPPPTTQPTGCMYNGQRYNVGDSFGDGYDPITNWCYGEYCSENGEVIHWDTWNCKTTPSPTTSTTTPIPTTTPPTTPPGCFYDGQHYAPGEEINSGEDISSNWCYGTVCDSSGNILAWDNLNCHPTTTRRTTFPPITTTQSLSQRRVLKKLRELLTKKTLSG